MQFIVPNRINITLYINPDILNSFHLDFAPALNGKSNKLSKLELGCDMAGRDPRYSFSIKVFLFHTKLSTH